MSRATEMHGFLPDDYVELRMQRRTNILWALIFLIVAGGIGWAYFIAQNKIRTAQDINASVTRDFSAAAKPIAQFQQMQEEQQRLNQKAELVGSLIERVNRSNILAELTNALPAGVYLSDFDLLGKADSNLAGAKTAFDRAKAAGAAKPIIYGVTIRLVGFAASDKHVADYMTNLEKSPLFAAVDFVETKEVAYKELKVRSFELELTLDPSADSRSLAQARADKASQSK